ncbi:ubiquitin carboxyl-terminal hydrolase-like protein [Xylariaceae sp. FL0255]|nr:ubiquitin carboxyl-terminal hydrolase-like protein [Xylariaceae sp. FL0255]
MSSAPSHLREAAASPGSLQPKSAELVTDQLEVSSVDNRKYRLIRLPNKLEALLVHDADTDKGSAALDVNVGYFRDDVEMPGMAHAVEHLLFMGTKKYPEENDYSAYLAAHSGSSNAFTGSTSTNYYFDVSSRPSNGEEPSEKNPSPLYGGLDRFAQFFIAPLFLAETLDRELRAVDSENKKNLQIDMWRLHQLEKSQADPKHPWGRFSTGNFKSLKTDPEAKGIDVRQKFIDFHTNHYSANRMKLCVLGREPLDVLQSWVEELFSGVKNKDLPQDRWEDLVPYGQDRLARQCFAKPVMDSRELTLFFPFLDEEKEFETLPSRYISHLIGHEGPGSIMAYIKSKGWANGLSAGSYVVAPGTPGIFDCHMRLTEEGLRNYQEVVKVFFQYVSILRQSPPQQWIFDEQREMADVEFKFKEKTLPSRFTSKTAGEMQKPLPREWLLSGEKRFRRFDPDLIGKGIALLRPDNLRMTLVSRDFPGGWDMKEKWYGTEYRSEKIPDDFLAELTQAWNTPSGGQLKALHLPHKNKFIPTKLEVEKKEIEHPATSPRVIRNDSLIRSWWKKDDTFWVPKASLFATIRNPLLYASAENSVKTKLLTDLARDALSEWSYDAEVAGLQYNVGLDTRGICIELSGYNDKLAVLLERVLQTVQSLTVKDDRFEIIKDRLARAYKNWELHQPYNQIGDYVVWLTSEHDHTVEQLEAEIAAISAEEVRSFHKQVMSQIHTEVYTHGNIYKEEALGLTQMMETILKTRVLPKEEWPIHRSLEYPPGSNYLFQKTLKDPANVNHCIEYYLYIGDKGDRMVRAKTQLLDQITHEPAFDQLRTKEQLGYIVFSGVRGSSTTYGFRFIIQSERTPEYLESRIDLFLQEQGKALREMSDEKFEGHKRAVINKRLEKLKNLDQESARHWTQISNEYYDFEASKEDAAQVEKLTKAEIVEFFDQFIDPTSPTRAKLVVQLVAQGRSPPSKEAEKGAAPEYAAKVQVNGVEPAAPVSNGTTPVLITDVRDFKIKLATTTGARPIHEQHQRFLTTGGSHSISHTLDRAFPELLGQLAAKTSSQKKRKITTRLSAARDEQLEFTADSPDSPLQSCEQDNDLNFSFASSIADVPVSSPAYLRADSLPPASSLPPRLQTARATSQTFADDGLSSVASSPSGACADLCISSDRGADTPAPDSGGYHRGSSPFTKTTHHRAVMGGATEFPERASSPLKRRASSMEPDKDTTQDGNEDVDMIAPPSGPTALSPSSTSEHPEHPSLLATDSSSQGETRNPLTEGTITAINDVESVRPTPVSIEAHINAIRDLIQEAETKPLVQDQECYIVSKRWLGNVPDGLPKKQDAVDLSSIPPVDNSDLILEVIDDPCVGTGVPDVTKRKFVRMNQGFNGDQFVAFPPAAWDLLIQWPGLKEGQFPIIRHASDTSEAQDGSNILFEWHPLVLSIHRLWSAHSRIPVEAHLKARNPPAPRLVRRSNTPFQAFLKQAKKAVLLNLDTRVRGWQVLNIPGSNPSEVTTTATSIQDTRGSTDPSSVWDHLLVDVESFLKLERGPERDHIDYGDTTNVNDSRASVKTLHSLGISKDQPIVLDPHEEGTDWTSSYVPGDIKPSSGLSNSTTSLTVQNHAPRAGRVSPSPGVPYTRGRANKTGRSIGCVGLTNLGNTCYMNAALQCVRSVEELTKYFLSGEWERELNKDNVLAHNGEVAATYAQLLKEIYRGGAPSAVTPRAFKNTIGRHAPQFSGYGQQDSQEFLGFLLDGLQEDLSRVKKKPYIEKPDSTDEMINDPEAIRRMADQVWDITRKRDDSVIADLFTGLYKSTLVCPICSKVSITFDPFNNLTLQLPVGQKWSHMVKFFPLNDKPINIKVEIEKHDNIKALKQFVSVRTGVPIERLHGSEEWNKKFYKHYLDNNTSSDDITSANDNAWLFELEAKPTNYPGKPQKQKYRSMIDEEPPPTSWDDEEAERLLVPVFHRRPAGGRTTYHSTKWTGACPPHFVLLTPQEARSEDIIRRKILEKIVTFTKNPEFAPSDDSDNSETTDPEMIGPSGSDTGSSIGGKVVAHSVKGEDDIVDVQMKDVGDTKAPAKRYVLPVIRDPHKTLKMNDSRIPIHHFNHKKPAWMDPDSFLPPQLQNLFEIGICSENSSPIPTGTNVVADEKDYPKLSSRIAPESPSSEDQLDDATNGTASNDESSSDDSPPRPSIEMPPTRMTEESEDETMPTQKVHPPPFHSWKERHFRITKLRFKSQSLTRPQTLAVRSRQIRQQKGNNKFNKKMNKRQIKGAKGKRQARLQRKMEKQNAMALDDFTEMSDPVPDGGPLVRLREGLVVDWSETTFYEVFGNNTSYETWDSCEQLADPELEKAQAARAKRRKNGVTLDECLDEFERDEILSEQDMWYCPRCKEHRRASKKLDLWKTPDILVTHLKRFSSSGYRRDKLETLVDFPVENLDVTSRVLQKEEGKQEVYDLIGVDCHFGGLGGGHYTAYARNFIDGQWYSYNDSSVTKTSPDRVVDASAYMLFYRRRSSVPLGGPQLRPILEEFANANGSDEESLQTGEGQRLGEGFSQTGSSSALQGAGVIHLQGDHGGLNSSALTLHRSATDAYEVDGGDDDGSFSSAPFRSRHDLEEDEGIELVDPKPSSFQFTGNTWNFDGITTGTSPADSGAASDEAQHDSSGDERALSSQHSIPGMLEYALSTPVEADPPSYTEPPEPVQHEYSTSRVWDIGHGGVHEIVPNSEQEQLSDDAAEIHLDDDDKIKV